jgi:hypothetical protein
MSTLKGPSRPADRRAHRAQPLPFAPEPTAARGTADEYGALRVVDDCEAEPGIWASAADWPDWIDDLVFQLDALEAEAEADDEPESEPTPRRGIPIVGRVAG